jgi:hypothetical protein
MTLLISWIGVDQRKESSIYIASESRISWNSIENKFTEKYDYTQKIFSCRNHPIIIGFCGEVIFPLITISQIAQLIDQGLFYNNSFDSAKKRYNLFFEFLSEKRLLFPSKTKFSGSFQILFVTRDQDKMNSRFFIRLIEYSEHEGIGKWHVDEPTYNDHSEKLFTLGSGKDEFLINYEKYKNSKIRNTTRSIFQCFCDTLENIQDPACGGPPQLADLYRIQNGRNFGIIHKENRYFLGAQIDRLNEFSEIEWRNDLFERVDPQTKEILSGAQKQPNPLKSN